MQMPLGAVTESFVNEIELLAPFGKGNRKPLFVEKNLEILEARILGKNKNVLKMYVRDNAGTVWKQCILEMLKHFIPMWNLYMGQ